MAEVGGLSVSIRESPIPGDAAGETYSSWRLDLVGVSGKTCTLKWRTFRKWNGSSVVAFAQAIGNEGSSFVFLNRQDF